MVLQNNFTNNGWKITNNATTRWIGGNITMNAGSAIENKEGAVFQVEGTNQMTGAGTFTNLGTFRKTLGLGVTLMQATFNSVQPGQMTTIDIQAGTISFTRTGSFQTHFTANNGVRVHFGGLAQTYTVLDGTTFAGGGTFMIGDSGTLLLADGATVTKPTLDPRLGFFAR